MQIIVDKTSSIMIMNAKGALLFSNTYNIQIHQAI